MTEDGKKSYIGSLLMHFFKKRKKLSSICLLRHGLQSGLIQGLSARPMLNKTKAKDAKLGPHPMCDRAHVQAFAYLIFVFATPLSSPVLSKQADQIKRGLDQGRVNLARKAPTEQNNIGSATHVHDVRVQGDDARVETIKGYCCTSRAVTFLDECTWTSFSLRSLVLMPWFNSEYMMDGAKVQWNISVRILSLH